MPFRPLAPRLITNVGISILLRASSHARDLDFNDVSTEIPTPGPRPDLMPERQCVDWVHSGAVAFASPMTPG